MADSPRVQREVKKLSNIHKELNLGKLHVFWEVFTLQWS